MKHKTLDSLEQISRLMNCKLFIQMRDKRNNRYYYDIQNNKTRYQLVEKYSDKYLFFYKKETPIITFKTLKEMENYFNESKELVNNNEMETRSLKLLKELYR